MKKAFTLIEVMVVLSILAIIAILAYNFFGGTMREAKESKAITSIVRNLNAVDQAWSKYELDTGQIYAPADSVCMPTFVSSGVLKAGPVLETYGNFAPPPGVYCNTATGYNVGGTAAADAILVHTYVTTDFCQKFNDSQTALGATVWTTNGTYDSWPSPMPEMLCYRSNG